MCIKPMMNVIAALAMEAHRVGLTVTGHVPSAINAFQGVEAGMDQINHLNYVTTMMRAPGAGRGERWRPGSTCSARVT